MIKFGLFSACFLFSLFLISNYAWSDDRIAEAKEMGIYNGGDDTFAVERIDAFYKGNYFITESPIPNKIMIVYNDGKELTNFYLPQVGQEPLSTLLTQYQDKLSGLPQQLQEDLFLNPHYQYGKNKDWADNTLKGGVDGDYLIVQDTSKTPNELVLVYRKSGKIYHRLIEREGMKLFTSDKKNQFESIDQLLSYYSSKRMNRGVASNIKGFQEMVGNLGKVNSCAISKDDGSYCGDLNFEKIEHHLNDFYQGLSDQYKKQITFDFFKSAVHRMMNKGKDEIIGESGISEALPLPTGLKGENKLGEYRFNLYREAESENDNRRPKHLIYITLPDLIGQGSFKDVYLSVKIDLEKICQKTPYNSFFTTAYIGKTTGKSGDSKTPLDKKSVANLSLVSKEFKGAKGVLAPAVNLSVAQGEGEHHEVTLHNKLFDGGSLEKKVALFNNDENRCLLLWDTLQGTCELHKKKYLHLDIKPENMFVNQKEKKGAHPKIVIADTDGIHPLNGELYIFTEYYLPPEIRDPAKFGQYVSDGRIVSPTEKFDSFALGLSYVDVIYADYPEKERKDKFSKNLIPLPYEINWIIRGLIAPSPENRITPCQGFEFMELASTTDGAVCKQPIEKYRLKKKQP